MLAATKSAEARRILDRYLVEVVEMYGLCPWARGARLAGEIAVELVWGAPSIDEWGAAAKRALAQPDARVAMVVAPELVIEPFAFHDLRNRVIEIIGTAGIAEFHPEAAIDLKTPARLVPFLRRSPDPMLQLVPLALLESVRTSALAVDRAQQAQILGGYMSPRDDVAARIAETNHETVSAQHVAIIATLDAIAEDRRTAYARVGISECR